MNIFLSLVHTGHFVFKHRRATIEAVCLNAGTVWEFRGCEFYDVFAISLKHDSRPFHFFMPEFLHLDDRNDEKARIERTLTILTSLLAIAHNSPFTIHFLILAFGGCSANNIVCSFFTKKT